MYKLEDNLRIDNDFIKDLGPNVIDETPTIEFLDEDYDP